MQRGEQLILERGYKEYPNPFRNDHLHAGERTFQKTFRDEFVEGSLTRIEGDNKRFIDVHIWDMSDIRSTMPLSYEIGATFDTPLGWVTMKFYSLNEDEFLKRFDRLESTIRNSFKFLSGIYQ